MVLTDLHGVSCIACNSSMAWPSRTAITDGDVWLGTAMPGLASRTAMLGPLHAPLVLARQPHAPSRVAIALVSSYDERS